jgi:DNA modification methylase
LFELRLGDALELLASLETASVDALITDPPYATTALAWDQPVDWPAFWREAERVCKPTAPMVVFSAQPFTTDLIASNRKHFRYDLIWTKTMGTRFLDAGRMPLRAHEHLAVFCQKGYGTYNRQLEAAERVTSGPVTRGLGERAHYEGVRTLGNNEGGKCPLSWRQHSNANFRSVHPTQKPLDLMRWLVRTYSNPNALVLDPFAGSGTTGVAALLESRRFIGSEREPKYHEIALRRLEDASCNLQLAAD